MFKQPTLFIVGAGASAEYKLPVGTKLAATISEKLDVKFGDFGGRSIEAGDIDLFGQIAASYPQEVRQYQNAAWLIRDGVLLSNSIDDFLDVHRADERAVLCGKAAIVRSILEAERHSTLFYDRSNIYNRMPFSRVEGTWLIKLMRMLGRGVPLANARNIFKNVSFIVFNYDRCIEHFFFTALKQFYNLQDDRVAEIMATLRIYHPYGKVAPLSYEGREGVEFGGNHEELRAPYVRLSKSIRTYTEQIADTEENDAIRQEMADAKNIVFLGFAFHDQNLRLLKPATPLEPRNMFGTAFGMSDSDVRVVKNELALYYRDIYQSMMRDAPQLINSMRCADLFDYYGKSLPA